MNALFSPAIFTQYVCCISFLSKHRVASCGSSWDALSYLLEASLNQVLREEVSDEVKKGIKTGNLIVLSSFSEILLEFWVSRVDEEHQDDSQHSSNDSSGHVIDHGSGAQTTTWLRIQTSQTSVREMWNIILTLSLFHIHRLKLFFLSAIIYFDI